MAITRSPRLPAHPLFLGLIAVLALAAAVLGWFLYAKSGALATLETEHAEQMASSTTRIAELETLLLDTRTLLEEELEENEELSEDLEEEQDRNDAFEEQIDKISGTVSDLDKLSKTDEELLEKYSKVYFLNEHYIPSDLATIDDEWEYTESETNQLHAKAMPFFEEMLEDAKEDGIDLWVASAYRSFEYQSALKGRYTVIYGSGANAFSADQGFSEHQLGTTVDFTTTGLGGGLQGFDATAAYEWLTENAHEYGFTLSYPPNNAFYVYEPWHWRFVGTELAEDLKDDGKYFYDLDQRTIDQYLLHIFD